MKSNYDKVKLFLDENQKNFPQEIKNFHQKNEKIQENFNEKEFKEKIQLTLL